MNPNKRIAIIISPIEFEKFGKRITLAGFALVVFIFIAAPVMAISWREQPFPGFFVEQTLVINQNEGENWSGWAAGISPGERVARIGGAAVFSLSDYDSALSSYHGGDQVVVITQMPDRSVRLYPEIAMATLSPGDFNRFFWLPYLLGLFYFGIGVWIYRARGSTHSGLALAIFCVITAAVCAVIFDLSTTHKGAVIFSTALSLIGAALISLAMCFPQEWKPLRKRIWLLATPYLVSIPLGIWNLAVSYDIKHPWAYQAAWAANYRFLSIGILFFIGVMIFHAVKSTSMIIRRQARIVLLGSGLAFLPLMLWFVAPLLGLPIFFNVSFLLPPLVLFPVSISIAILRYRLLEIDAIVNRTIVYGLVTAILAGIFGALVTTSQRLFMALTGEKSDVAIIITTVVVSAIFPSVRTRIQAFVDNKFREAPDNTKDLRKFSEQVRAYLIMNNVEQLTKQLLDECAAAVGAECGALSLLAGNQSLPRVIHTYRQWKGNILVQIPVEWNGVRYGFLMLGQRFDGRSYSRRDYQVLYQVSAQIAAAIQVNKASHDNLISALSAR